MVTSSSETVSFGEVGVLEHREARFEILPTDHQWADHYGVSVIIPAWNEELRLPRALDRYLPLLEATARPFEVIVVADGVTDATVEVARRYETRGVRVLSFDEKLGKGGAVLEGFRSARYDTVGFLDADAPVTTVNVAYLLSELTSSDAAIASRWVSKARGHQRESLARRVLSRGWNLLTRSVLQLGVKDTQCGAKFFRRQAVSGVLHKVVLTNWAFDASLLFHFKRAGHSIAEIPVDWTDDAFSKMKVEKAVPAMLLSLIGIRLMSLPHLSRRVEPVARWLHHHLAQDAVFPTSATETQ